MGWRHILVPEAGAISLPRRTVFGTWNGNIFFEVFSFFLDAFFIFLRTSVGDGGISI
jgi:hypothetical protein